MSSLFCLTLWKSYLFNCRTKLAKLLCLKCFGRINLVNFSFCHHCQHVTAANTRGMTYFENDEALSSLAPAHDRFIRRVFEHSVILRISPIVASRLPVVQLIKLAAAHLYSFRTCAKVRRGDVGSAVGTDLRSHWNCWPLGRPYRRLCPCRALLKNHEGRN